MILIPRCIVARRKDALDKVKDECVALGLPTDRVLCLAGDLTNTDHLISIREIIVEGKVSPGRVMLI